MCVTRDRVVKVFIRAPLSARVRAHAGSHLSTSRSARRLSRGGGVVVCMECIQTPNASSLTVASAPAPNLAPALIPEARSRTFGTSAGALGAVEPRKSHGRLRTLSALSCYRFIVADAEPAPAGSRRRCRWGTPSRGRGRGAGRRRWRARSAPFPEPAAQVSVVESSDKYNS